MSNMTDLWLSGVFLSSKYSKTRFRPGLRPATPLVGWGGGHPLIMCPPPHSLPLRRFWRLDLGAFELRLSGTPTQIPGYAYATTIHATSSSTSSPLSSSSSFDFE